MSRLTEGGICSRKLRQQFLDAVHDFAPCWFPAGAAPSAMTERASLNQLATLLFSTLSITRPSSPRRTGRAVAVGDDQRA